MDRRLRILHVTASHRWTGAAEPAARVAAGQTQLGHEVLFALTAGSSFDRKARELGVVTTDRVPFERSYLPHKKLRDLRLLRGLVAEWRPDIVHAHLTHDHLMAAWALGPRDRDKPLLVRTFHREEPPRRGPVMRGFAMKRTTGAIAVSESLAQQVRAAFDLETDQVAAIGGGIDMVRFAPTDRGARLRARWNIPADAVVIGLVSRLRVARGVAWLLDAAEDVLPSIPNARLVICGRGNYQDEMVERLKTHPARTQIHYAGYVTGEDLEDSYNAFDAALMLKPGNDGACRSALEAMACARPVIGGDMGAIRDLLSGGDAGWLVPPDDRAALGNAIRHAATHIDDVRARGQAARARVEAMYGEEAMTRRTVDFYLQLLERYRP